MRPSYEWPAKAAVSSAGRAIDAQLFDDAREVGRRQPQQSAAAWLRFIQEDRERKPSTLKDYRLVLNAYLLPAFGDRELESIEPGALPALMWQRRTPATRG